MFSYDTTLIWVAAEATEIALSLSQAFQAEPQRGIVGGVVRAAPIGLTSMPAAIVPPPMKPSPAWSKKSLSKSSTAVHWLAVPEKRLSRRPGMTPLAPARTWAR